jgi:hypothetical protein
MPTLRSCICFALPVQLVFLSAPAISAEEFSIQIASPVAAQSYQMKRSAFVFRAVGCPAPTKPEVSATAEGRIDGQRRSVPLKVLPAPTPAVFGIFRDWPNEGVWIVNITGHCASTTASALVATDAKGFIRESSVIFPRAATPAEIDAALSQLSRK